MPLAQVIAVIVITVAWRKTGDEVMCFLFWLTCFIVFAGNIKKWKLAEVTVLMGLTSNAIITLWNGGVMPVVGMPATMHVYFPIWSGNKTGMLLLADRASWNYFSPGDFIIMLGLFLYLCRQGGSMLRKLWASEQGQDIAEYAVMLAVILVIVIGTVRIIGSNANNVFQNVGSAIAPQ